MPALCPFQAWLPLICSSVLFLKETDSGPCSILSLITQCSTTIYELVDTKNYIPWKLTSTCIFFGRPCTFHTETLPTVTKGNSGAEIQS